jgi:hypothetical protein
VWSGAEQGSDAVQARLVEAAHHRNRAGVIEAVVVESLLLVGQLLDETSGWCGAGLVAKPRFTVVTRRVLPYTWVV